jgi:UDP-glucose 4-epimerase
MRVVVTGAASNVGRSVVEALAERDEVSQIIGLAGAADIASSNLASTFHGADAVVHLAWAVQPTHSPEKLERLNVNGSRQVFDAVAAAGVPKLIHSSSVVAYSPAPRDRLIDENWPLGCTETSIHARYKATIEGHLDDFERTAPNTQVVRLRPALTCRGDAAAELCGLLAGPFIPDFLLRSGLLPAIPRLAGLCFQAIHTSDLARAYALATVRDVSGAFNLAAGPLLGTDDLAAMLNLRTFPLSFSLARRLADLSWRLRLQPTPPDWLDMAMGLPLVSSERAGRELGWEPRVNATEALSDLFAGRRPGNGTGAAVGGPAMRLGDWPAEVEATQAEQPRETKLLRQLVSVHAIERQALVQMRRAPRLVGDERLAAVFVAHADKTAANEQRLRERLRAHGRGVLDGSSERAGGIAMAVFGASEPDTPAKLLAHTFAYEHLEIAAYELLQKRAEEAGDEETAVTARQLDEEARRMADRLEDSFDFVLDASLNGGGEVNLAAQLNRCMADVHAIEKQGLQLLETGPRVIEDEALKRFFAAHLRESEEHEAMIRERIEARGAKPARAGDAVLQVTGMQVGAFFAAQPDTTEKLVGFVSAFEHLEIAAYELLERAARRAGDHKVTGVAERVLAEERAAVEALAQAAAGS